MQARMRCWLIFIIGLLAASAFAYAPAPKVVFTQISDNRLVLMTANTNTPSASRKSLKFDYDWQGRRISKGAGA